MTYTAIRKIFNKLFMNERRKAMQISVIFLPTKEGVNNASQGYRRRNHKKCHLNIVR